MAKSYTRIPLDVKPEIAVEIDRAIAKLTLKTGERQSRTAFIVQAVREKSLPPGSRRSRRESRVRPRRPPAVTRPSCRSCSLSFPLRGGSPITIGHQQNPATDPRQSAQRQGVVINIANSTNHEPSQRR